MVNSISVKKSLVEKEGRFNPKYFTFLEYSKKLVKNSKHKFIKLGDKDYFDLLNPIYYFIII